MARRKSTPTMPTPDSDTENPQEEAMTATTDTNTDVEVEPTEVESTDVEVEDLDVEEPDADTETETEEVDGEGKPEGKHDQGSNKPKKGELPEGYVTPIQFAKVVGERGLHTDRDGNVVRDVKPQMVYSYMRNSPKDDRLEPIEIEDSNGVTRSVLVLDDAIAWWERKNERAAQRKQNAASKAEKAANKGKQSQQALVETGEADPSTLVDAEEAE